jgi:hypothetical protein
VSVIVSIALLFVGLWISMAVAEARRRRTERLADEAFGRRVDAFNALCDEAMRAWKVPPP